ATGSLEVPHPVDPRRLLFDIVRFTFALEVIGAAGLYLAWEPILGTEAIWHAIFHSISAFCNAGFSTLPDGLISMQTNPLGLILIMALIILGGLGFLTMEEVLLRFRAVRRNQPFRLSLHSRLVLSTTFWLILLGWALFMLLEGSRTLIDMTWPNRLVNALFLSVTPRTAGFNTIDYAKAGETSNFFTVLLMTVGGSPGSTAGGIKTTTLALICLTAWSRFRGVSVVSAFDRSVRQELLARAIGLVVLAFVVVISGTMILTITEEGRPTPEAFLGRLFEAVSAFNTVGLTMGVTPHLSAWGKWTVILLMFIGRVGTLTFVGAVSRQVEQGRFRYAYEDVMIG
ncbi:MAG: TrkH family potassium uptake protein, partial [Gemmataceae bacterium]